MTAQSKSGGNTISGTAGADHLNGGAGADDLRGLGGNDRINGGSGNDILDGGAGNDIVSGDSGDDLLVYGMGENAGSTDTYDGGSGRDTLQLTMTRAEWQSPAVQADIARYLAFLAEVTNPVNGQANNRNFTFSSGLTVSKFESLSVIVDGVALDPRDEAVTLGDDVMSAGEETASISVDVLANDSVPDLIASLTNTQPAHGSVVLTQTSGAPGTPDTASFVYTPDAGHWQYLAEGQTATDTFTYTVTDSDGDVRTATVTVTITGSNDAPVITAADVAGGVTEAEPPADQVSSTPVMMDIESNNTFATAQTINRADLRVAPGNTNLADPTDPSVRIQGSVATSADQDVFRIDLQPGETLTLDIDFAGIIPGVGGLDSFVFLYDAAGNLVNFNDDSSTGLGGGGSTSTMDSFLQFVSAAGGTYYIVVKDFDLFGQSSAGTYALNVSVDSQNLQLTDTGAMTFADVDLRDGHTVSVAAQGADYLGALTAVVSNASTNDGVGAVQWTFSVANAAVQFLAEGETRTQSYVVSVDDGQGGVASETVTITVTGDNDRPTISTAFSSGQVIENVAPSASGVIAFDDVDLIDGHSVTSAADAAGYLGTFSASVSDAATGAGAGEVTWAFNASDAELQYLAAGQSLLQRYIVTIDDGNGGTTQQLVNITIVGTNDAPTITAAVSSGALLEDDVTSVAGAIAFADADLRDGHTVSSTADGAGYLGTFSATMTDDGSNDGAGSVSWNFAVDNAAIQYLAAGEVLTQTYIVTVSDGQGGTVSQPVNVTITGTNDGPVANADAATTNEDTSVLIDVLANDTDVDGPGLSIVAGSVSATNGTAVIEDGQIRFTPNENYNGPATVTYTTTDGTLNSVGTASVTVAPVNDAPVANDDVLVSRTTTQLISNGGFESGLTGWTVTNQGSGNFSVESDNFPPNNTFRTPGAFEGSNYVVTFQSGPGIHALEQSFVVPNGLVSLILSYNSFAQTNAGTVINPNGLTLSGSNQHARIDLLTAGSSALTTGSDVIRNFFIGVDGRPTQGWHSASFDITTLVTPGQTFDLRFAQADNMGNFNFGVDGVSIVAVVGVARNEDDAFTIPTADLLANDSDVDGDTLTVTAVAAISAQGGSVSLSGGVITYDPGLALQRLAAGETATDSFSYTISDGAGGTDTATVSFTITGTNDGPTITAFSNGAVVEDGAVTASGTVTFADVDLSDGHTATSVATGTGYFGVFTTAVTDNGAGDGAGSVTWNFAVDNAAIQHLAAGQVVTQTYSVTVSDGNGGSISQPVTVTITGTNDAPVAVADSVSTSEDGSLTLAAATLTANDSDIDGDSLSVLSVDGSDSVGTVQLVGGQVVYTAGSAFQTLRVGETALDRFSYTVTDASGATATATVDVVINGANDAPTAGDDSAFSNAGGSVIINVLANDSDPEGEAITIASVGTAGNGAVVINADGTVTYTPNAGFSGNDTFTYAVQDASGAVDTATVSVVVGLSDHDRVGGDVFLQGNFMEIGVSSSGSLGTANAAPSNYHPQGRANISYVVDTDGWTSGAAPRAGDFTLPGSPVDTIVLGFNGVSYAQDERSGRRGIDTTTTDISTDTLLGARTVGVAGGAVQLSQTITLDPGATYYTTTITVTNISGAAVNDVRFLRSFDPDQDQYRFGTFNTNNDVLSNPSAGNDLAVARALGAGSGVSVNLLSFDSDARASNYGFGNYNAYAPQAFTSPVDRNGQSVDEAITMAFDFGTLAAGATMTKVFYTSLNGSSQANDMLIGGNGADVLNAGAGNDFVIGLTGNDQLTGGTGNDQFVFTRGSGHDVVTDFTAGSGTDDVLELRGFGYSDLAGIRAVSSQVGADVVINLSATDTITLRGVQLADLAASDFLFDAVASAPAAALALPAAKGGEEVLPGSTDKVDGGPAVLPGASDEPETDADLSTDLFTVSDDGMLTVSPDGVLSKAGPEVSPLSDDDDAFVMPFVDDLGPLVLPGDVADLELLGLEIFQGPLIGDLFLTVSDDGQISFGEDLYSAPSKDGDLWQ